ncbi:MAG TPA: hypothetical protein VIN75_01365 [Burkholderiaceae bacterium]
MPDLRPSRWPARALSTLALTAILAGCTTPPAPVAQAPKPVHQIPAGARQALAQRFPGRRIVADSHGPLLAADVDAVAVVLDGDAPGAFVVAVLAPPAAAGADWRVIGTSRPIVPGCAKCSVSADLAPHGLYVRVIRAEGAGFENFTYQFAGTEGGDPLRLVGVTAYIPSRADDPSSHSFSASVDLLTGQRTDIVEESGSDGATTHRERQGSVPLRAPIAFDDFAFTAEALDAETRRSPPVAFDPAGTLPAAAVDALRERFPRMTVQSQSSGALRGEGRDIVAVLVPADRAARAGAAADAVVAVLLAQPDGSLHLADVSGAMAHACPTCDVQVQVARHTLSVETTEVTPTGSVSTDWQFAFRPKDAPLRLVGLRTETTVRGDDGTGRRSTVTSTNLVNGDRVEVTDSLVNGRRRRNEQKSRLQVRAPVLLSDFAFDPSVLGDDIAAGTDVARLSGS